MNSYALKESESSTNQNRSYLEIVECNMSPSIIDSESMLSAARLDNSLILLHHDQNVANSAKEYMAAKNSVISKTLPYGINDILEAFEFVPAESRGQLNSYFESPLGKYVLPKFLSSMSAWWVSVGRNNAQPSPERSMSGIWKDDPCWDIMMQKIEDDRKKDMELYK